MFWNLFARHFGERRCMQSSKPSLELLEDRCLLANNYYWDPLNLGNLNWSLGSNWVNEALVRYQNGNPPTSADAIIFGNAQFSRNNPNANATDDMAALQSIATFNITLQYTGTITLNRTNFATLDVTTQFTMLNGTVTGAESLTIVNGNPSQNLSSWQGGTITGTGAGNLVVGEPGDGNNIGTLTIQGGATGCSGSA